MLSLSPAGMRRHTGAPLKFAVAFKSRSGKQEGRQVQKDTALATTPAPAGGLILPGGCGGLPECAKEPLLLRMHVPLPRTAADAPGSLLQMQSQAAKEGGASIVNAPMDSSAKAGIASGESQGVGVCISRERGCSSSSERLLQGMWRCGAGWQRVDLEQPQAVICLEVLPVGASTIAAVSIVDSSACVLRPRLVLKSLQVCK